jgi:uncharacterized membrane protein
MVLSETIQYVTILAVTIIFTAFALGIQDKIYKTFLKVLAGLCWFVMALIQFYFMGTEALLALPLMFMYLGIGMVFSFSMLADYLTTKKERMWKFD